MTASLLVFVPVALLALVAGFCFVGCVLQTHGLAGPPFTTYSDTDIIGNSNCVAYWPLNDSPGQTTALDIVGKAKGNPHNGTYMSAPCPGGELAPMSHTAAAPGTLTIGAPGIVKGDTVPPHDPDNPIPATCVQVDGAWVTVPANDVTNPAGSFSVEVWVQPEWAQNDPPVTRMIVDSRDPNGNTGFSIHVNEAGNWRATLGDSMSTGTVVLDAGKADLAAPTHIVLTYDGANGRLFINGSLASPVTSAPNYVPNVTTPLVIGVGGAYRPPRTQMSELDAFPLWPFKGKIQDVAIYNVALDETTINNHSENGKGNVTDSTGT